MVNKSTDHENDMIELAKLFFFSPSHAFHFPRNFNGNTEHFDLISETVVDLFITPQFAVTSISDIALDIWL